MNSHKKAQNSQTPPESKNLILPSVSFVPFCGKEAELLLCCARTKPAPRLRELDLENIDWNYFFLLARRHAVVPLVYHQLKDLLPERFKQYYLENAARNIILTNELCRIVKLFADAGIDAIPYKGPILSLIAYGDLSLRRFVDLDVIVRKQDVLCARDLMLADNYTLSKQLTESQQEMLLRTQHNLQFTKDNRQLIVELHWEVAPHLFASTVQGDALWENLVEFDLNGTKVKTFCAGDLLFSLCVHGSRHLWERLGWICDVAELIGSHEIEWPALLERAKRSDSERMFLLGVHLAEKLLDANLPPEVKRRCEADKRLASLTSNVVEHLFNGPEHVPATSTEIFRYNLGVRKSLTARTRYLAHILRPTDGDVGSHSLPPRLSFAYYLMRPFRLIFSHKKAQKSQNA